MAAEVLVITNAIRALIRDDKVHQIYSLMQAGQKYGMQTMNQSLCAHVLSREVSEEEALRRSNDPDDLLRMLGRPVGAAGGANGRRAT
jgi:twitching motility protein PilT